MNENHDELGRFSGEASTSHKLTLRKATGQADKQSKEAKTVSEHQAAAKAHTELAQKYGQLQSQDSVQYKDSNNSGHTSAAQMAQTHARQAATHQEAITKMNENHNDKGQFASGPSDAHAHGDHANRMSSDATRASAKAKSAPSAATHEAAAKAHATAAKAQTHAGNAHAAEGRQGAAYHHRSEARTHLIAQANHGVQARAHSLNEVGGVNVPYKIRRIADKIGGRK